MIAPGRFYPVKLMIDPCFRNCVQSGWALLTSCPLRQSCRPGESSGSFDGRFVPRRPEQLSQFRIRDSTQLDLFTERAQNLIKRPGGLQVPRQKAGYISFGLQPDGAGSPLPFRNQFIRNTHVHRFIITPSAYTKTPVNLFRNYIYPISNNLASSPRSSVLPAC